MWRDLNCFNEMRIPSLTYGPGVSVGGGSFRMPVETLITGTKLYDMTALDCATRNVDTRDSARSLRWRDGRSSVRESACSRRDGRS
jgi:hypothetical protein